MKCILTYLGLTILLFHELHAAAESLEDSSRFETVVVVDVTPMPPGVLAHNLGSIGGRLFLLGGRDFDGEVSDSCYVQAEDELWSSFNLDHPVRLTAMAEVNQRIYLIGGYAGKDVSRRVSKLTWKDGELEEVPLKELPSPRAGSRVAVVGSVIYVLGGISFNGAEMLVNTFWSLDVSQTDPQWQVLDPLPGSARIGSAVRSQNGAVYVFGGNQVMLADDQGPALYEMRRSWCYRPVPIDGFKDRGWTELQRTPESLGISAVLPIGQSNLMCYGQKQIWSYHTITDTWSPLGEVQDLLITSRIALCGERILLLPKMEADGSSPSMIKEFKFTMQSAQLHWLDYALIACYLIALILIGRKFAQSSKTSSGFFLAGRKIPYWAAGISLYATGTSGISFLAIPTKIFVTNQVYGLGTLFGPLFMVLAAFLIVPLLRGINITSTYEYLDQRFNRSVRLFGAALSVAFQLGGRMSVVLLLPAFALTAVTGINVYYAIAIMGFLATLYTVTGGIAAVIWTDVLQVSVLFGGAVLAFVFMIADTEGGFSGFVDINMAHSKFDALHWGWDWTLPVIWVFMLNQLSAQATFPSDQVMVQRVLSTPGVKEARKSYILLGLIVVPGTILFHLLGSSLFSYFHSHPDILNPMMDNIQVFPLYIVEVLPIGLTGLLIAALFAACMSTLDSSMHSVSTVILTDFYRKREDDEGKHVRLAKLLTGVVGVFGTAIALMMATFEIKSMFDLWMEIIALIGGGFGGVFLLGMFTKSANSKGALIGAAASIIVTIFVKSYTDIHFMLYSSVAVGTCILVGYLASFLFAKSSSDLKGLTVYTREK